MDAERLGLVGKPAPDIFLEAARQLVIEPRRAVVIEDAAGELPSALACGEDIASRLESKRAALFLDYDGTLTPIVSQSE